MINKYDGFIFDLDGTIYIEDKIIPQADFIINRLKELDKKVVFISNKTTGNINTYLNFLKNNGFNISEDEIINSTVVIKKYLEDNHPKQNFFAVGEKIFIEEIKSVGLEFKNDPLSIDIVIVTLDRTLNYNKLEIAAKALDNGAKFYAANIDNTCPVEGGEILDAGSTISALEKRTHRKLEKHFGKPSEYMFNGINDAIKVPPEKCLIIGDRLETDIAMGNIFGVDTALVSTGVVKELSVNGKYKPTYKLNSVSDLIKIL